MISRRRVVLALGVGALWAPLGLFAQQRMAKVWRIGYLSMRPAPTSKYSGGLSAFTQGMRDLGYVEGTNLAIESRFAAGDLELLSAFAADLVRQKVDVIVVNGGTRVTRVAQNATATIPIVFSGVGDPVRAGFANSLAKPGGNLTGITNMAGSLELKRFEVLREILPRLRRIAYLSNPEISESLIDKAEMQAALKRIGVDVLWLNARNTEEIERAFVELARQRVHGAIFATENTFSLQVQKLADLATKYKLPAAMGFPEAAEAGLLVSYGVKADNNSLHAANYVDKILKGAKPGGLPIEQPTKFELIINLRTAKALSIKIPESILFRADRVIE